MRHHPDTPPFRSSPAERELLSSARSARARRLRRARKVGFRSLSVLFSGALLAWAFVAAPPSISRGPYLQNVSETQITVVFQTEESVPTTLSYGTRAGPPWQATVDRASGTTHVFTLQGLRPETKYFYAVESGGTKIAGGDDYFFRTSPPEKSRAPFRFLAWGDSGTGSTSQIDVAEQMEKVVPPPELALGLGDLVYDDGEWENYDPHLFEPYVELFRRLTFWPTLGNHDVKTEGGAPYLDAFYLPTKSGAPSNPSNTEKYYSFDHGMAHFVCVDSETSSTSPGSAMYDWLSDDLDDARARGKRWLFVFMHHPPYSKGTHDSDSEGELRTLRQNLVPLFDAKSVDMVMVGHSHVYERSYLARDGNVLQNDPDDYTKITSPNGTLYLVSGCGGKTGSGDLDHPLMAKSYGNVAGFSMIDVTWEEVRGSFVERDGETTDIFRLRKAADTAPPRVTLASNPSPNIVEVVFDEPVKPGTAIDGAENAANYRVLGAAVLDAALSSDRLTVTLRTTALWAGRAYLLRVGGIADRDGNVDPADQRAYFLAGEPYLEPPEGGGSSGSAGVPRGATWRYFKGTATPSSAWTSRGFFDDSSWSQGPAGFGYADGDDATVLGDMLGNYATVYLRAKFTIPDVSQVTGLQLGMDYDDGFVAFINGVEVARVNVPLGQKHDTLAITGHEAGTFESFDLNGFRSALVSGENVLAVEGHNGLLDSSDFTLHPELRATLAGGSGSVIPTAVLDSDVATANGPAWVHFSSDSSSDARAPFRRVIWDFGDGTRSTDPTVDHLYTRDGTYTATLIVRDQQFIDAIDQRTIRIHSQGNPPLAWLTASSLRVDVGERVDFNSAGSSDPDGGPVYVHWDFGDPGSGAANRSTQPSTSHVFNAPGAYDVTLAITDDEGSTVTRVATITVN